MQREQLPLQLPIQFIISIAISVVGLLVGNIGNADVARNVLVETAQADHADEETVVGGDVVDAAHPARNDDETVDGGDVVDAAHPARNDDETVDGGNVVDAAHPAPTDDETVAGGKVEIGDVATVASQQVSVGEVNIAIDAVDEQPVFVGDDTADQVASAVDVGLARASRDGTTEDETAEDYFSY
ncbi:hypothetical protein GGI13_006671, partial [Coemansia sp. RSA 455]